MKLIYRPIYWIYHATSGLWYWSRRRFTQAGFCVVGGFIVAGETGVEIENTVAYQSFTFLLGFLLLALSGGFFFRGEFSATRLLPRVGTAGQPLRYRVVIKNLTAKNQTGLTLLEDLADQRPSFAEAIAETLRDLVAEFSRDLGQSIREASRVEKIPLIHNEPIENVSLVAKRGFFQAVSLDNES